MTGRVRFRFDGKNEAAQKAAQRYAARLVKNVSAETRAAIRAIIARAIAEGIPPYDAARLIRGLVGMTVRDAHAALNYRTRLINSGLLQSRVETLLSRYIQTKIRQRAITIARTEIMGALNRGAQAAWKQAVKGGYLSHGATKEWLTTPDERLCPICASLEGEIQPINQPFSVGVQMPPAHPRCRCTAVPGAAAAAH